jgi:hypothetical protein
MKILSALENAYGTEISRPEISQVVTNLFLPLSSFFKEITLLVDGVDECRQSEISVIWNELDKILKKIPAKVLIGSEDQTNLHFKGFNRIRVDHHHNKVDIDTYIDEQIAGFSGPRQIFGDEFVRQDIKKQLQIKADGMFVSS